MLGILYIVSTPIGNLEDITFRALRVLREVDLILAEDTRVTRKLLGHYEIKKEIVHYDEHNHARVADWIREQLEQGKNIALVSDAGTPGISDPGQRLISHLVIKSIGHSAKIIPIPGPSALIAALSISGFPTDEFRFLGFPPHKKGRETFFRELAQVSETVIFYESPHRILKTLEQLEKFVSTDREIMIARELTKMFETVYRGRAGDIKEKIPAKDLRGEFVVVLSPKA